MGRLTNKQRAFINEYLISWNATQAAIASGYSEKSARTIGPENLSKPVIAAEIARRVAEMTMGANEALKLLSDIARGSIEDFITVGGRVPVIDFEKAQQAGQLGLVKKLMMSEGKISFELYDKQRALETIAKLQGLFVERVEHGGEITVKVEYDDYNPKTTETP
jgi:phage terminase small subunit